MRKYACENDMNDKSAISAFQIEVSGIMNADPVLNGSCQFLAENIRDIDFQIRRALGKQGIVAVVMTPTLVYRGKDDETTWWDAVDAEIDITENPTVSRGTASPNVMTAQDVACRVMQILGQPGLGHAGDFCPKKIETSEWEGLLLSKVTFDSFVRIPKE